MAFPTETPDGHAPVFQIGNAHGSASFQQGDERQGNVVPARHGQQGRQVSSCASSWPRISRLKRSTMASSRHSARLASGAPWQRGIRAPRPHIRRLVVAIFDQRIEAGGLRGVISRLRPKILMQARLGHRAPAQETRNGISDIARTSGPTALGRGCDRGCNWRTHRRSGCCVQNARPPPVPTGSQQEVVVEIRYRHDADPARNAISNAQQLMMVDDNSSLFVFPLTAGRRALVGNLTASNPYSNAASTRGWPS